MTETAASTTDSGGDAERARPSLDRRRFVGYVLGGSTLITAASMLSPTAAAALDLEVPSLPQIPELIDLEDLQTLAAAPTAGLIAVRIDEQGEAHFALPRAEVGQGIVTSTTMILAEELDLPMDKIHVTLAPARPELLFNQLTGGSNTTVSTFEAVRVAGALARMRLLSAAAQVLDVTVDELRTLVGTVVDAAGNILTFGELSSLASSEVVERVEVVLSPPETFRVIGTGRRRTDAREAVTGTKQFAMDLDVPNALPTMVCRPPTHMGKPVRLRNKAEILRMRGVTHVAIIETGVAVRCKTFGQCIDAIRKMDVEWDLGDLKDESDDSILERLRRAEIPMVVPEVPVGARQIDLEFEFMFRSSAALEPYAAIADVRENSAEIWAGLKAPILAQTNIARELGMLPNRVTVNVVTSGGSFGHKLFGDHAIEAARASQAMGVPVRLMWHRADEPRQGRLHPMCTSRVRATMLRDEVLTFEQRHTSVVTDFSHGFGEAITSALDELPTELGRRLGGLVFSELIFTLTQELPYNLGLVTQLLSETDQRFSTGSMRNIYSPDVCVAAELTLDEIARQIGQDPLELRLRLIRDARVRRTVEAVAKRGDWGKRMPAGTAQGIALHKEYKGNTAVLVEIDCRPATVKRKIRDAVTGPRVTKAVIGVDAGLVVNPMGLEAQMQGGFMDGMALTLTSSCHLRDGAFLEASWDNYYYTRQWNVPPEMEVVIMDPGVDIPGGAGEAAVGSSAAAVACAYARATGRVPTRFPINHGEITFKPKTFIPPVPPSPTNGLKFTY
ncbi:molybdopterin cofactor-binding domain-containing protein [Nocardioides sp.]|uniref:molybdopterin cofactor-binding domain-containing protein n=1 Tax=Nocardioides sp. TaxID=35761 RepID=UPI0026139922|nr:molybdopterin cofactor-binding domain-containing protein [Nocardioides sp.]